MTKRGSFLGLKLRVNLALSVLKYFIAQWSIIVRLYSRILIGCFRCKRVAALDIKQLAKTCCIPFGLFEPGLLKDAKLVPSDEALRIQRTYRTLKKFRGLPNNNALWITDSSARKLQALFVRDLFAKKLGMNVSRKDCQRAAGLADLNRIFLDFLEFCGADQGNADRETMHSYLELFLIHLETREEVASLESTVRYRIFESSTLNSNFLGGKLLGQLMNYWRWKSPDGFDSISKVFNQGQGISSVIQGEMVAGMIGDKLARRHFVLTSEVFLGALLMTIRMAGRNLDFWEKGNRLSALTKGMIYEFKQTIS